MISSNKSIIFNSERGRDIYVENQRIIIKLSPESCPLLNTSDSYLQFSLLMGNAKTRQPNPNYVIPDPALGGACPFHSITIRTGDGSTVLEQMDSVAIWTAFKNYYGSNVNDENLRAIFEGKAQLVNQEYFSDNTRTVAQANTRAWSTNGAGNEAVPNPSRGGGFGSQYYEMSEEMASDNAKKAQVQYRFPMSGLLSSMKTELLPIIALGGLIIELTLLDSAQFLRLQQCDQRVSNTVNRHQFGYGDVSDEIVQKTINSPNQVYGDDLQSYGFYGYIDDTGADQAGDCPAGTDIQGIILQNIADAGVNKKGLDSVRNCSIKVGSRVRGFYELGGALSANNQSASLIGGVVTKVEFTAERVHIHFGDFTTQAAVIHVTTGVLKAGSPVVCSLTSAGTPSLADANNISNTAAQLTRNLHRYEVSDVEFVANCVETPPQYLQAMIKQVRAGKLRIQYNSYRDIPVNIPIGSLANEMNIFTDLQRCYSLFGVNEHLITHSFLNDSFSPSADNLRDYQFQIAGVNTPNQSVPLGRMAQNRVDVLAMIELEKSLTESSIPVKNLKNPSRFFVIGRRLGAYGSAVSMLGKSLKCRVNYQGQQPLALLYHWFLYHTKMIEFENGQVVVRE